MMMMSSPFRTYCAVVDRNHSVHIDVMGDSKMGEPVVGVVFLATIVTVLVYPAAFMAWFSE